MSTLHKSFYYLFLAQLASIIFSIAAAQMLYAILFFIWLVLFSIEKKIIITWYDSIFLMFIVVRILSIIFSEYPDASALSYLREIIFYPYYFIVKYFVQEYELPGIKNALTVLIASLVIPALYAIVSVITGQVERGASFSGGYSMFAVHSAFVFVFTLTLLFIEERRKYQFLLLALLLLFFSAVLVTYTRAMWIAIVCSLMFVGCIGYRKYLLSAAIAVGVLIVSIPSLSERFSSLFAPMQHSSGRLELWSAAVELIPKHPFFGFGPETFNTIIGDKGRLPDQFVNSWHNEILQTQIESGFAATLLLVLIYGSLAWIIYRLYSERQTTDGRFIFLFTALSFVVTIPSIFFGSIMYSILNGMMLKFILACSAYFAHRNNLIKQLRRSEA